jgi:hypothetical protein
MADALKTSALVAMTGAEVADDDLFYIVDVSEPAATAGRKITRNEARIAMGGALATTVVLTSADLAALDTVPFELVPAPAVGSVNLLYEVALYLESDGGSLDLTDIGVGYEGAGNLLNPNTGSMDDGYGVQLQLYPNGNFYRNRFAKKLQLLAGAPLVVTGTMTLTVRTLYDVMTVA